MAVLALAIDDLLVARFRRLRRAALIRAGDAAHALTQRAISAATPPTKSPTIIQLTIRVRPNGRRIYATSRTATYKIPSAVAHAMRSRR